MNSNKLSDGTLSLLLEGAAMILIVTGIRFSLIWRFGSDLPYWDQWGAEGQELIKKYFDGLLGFRDWFAPSNDHRIFFTRVEALALVLLNKQWDARLEMAVNAIIYSCFSGALYCYLALGFGRLQRIFWFCACAVVFTFPFGFENTISGFQSQFYYLAVISSAAIALFCCSKAFSPGWVLGGLALLSAIFTMSSGMLASYALIATGFIVLFRERERWRMVVIEELPSILACVVVALTGLKLMVIMDGLALHKAGSIFQFAEALTACMAWPNIGSSQLYSIFCWFPYAVLLAAYARGDIKNQKVERFVVALGIWAFLQLSGIAYARATTVYTPRYSDLLGFALLINAFCLNYLLSLTRRKIRYFVLLPLLLLWYFVNGVSLYELSFNDGLRSKKLFYEVEAANTGAYLATNRYSFLVPKMDNRELPHPNPAEFERQLNDPTIRSLLPVSVRPPLKVAPVTGLMRQGANMLGILQMPLHPGERVWTIPATTTGGLFEGFASKSDKLPYVVFYVIGNISDFVVKDSENRAHRVNAFPVSGASGYNGVWQPVYAYCPGVECRISGVVTGVQVTFSEPREMAGLSLFALLATAEGMRLFWIGIALAIVAVFWRGLRQWISRTRFFKVPVSGLTSEAEESK